MSASSKNLIAKIKLEEKFRIYIHDAVKIRGTIQPITYRHIGDDLVIEDLMNWRNENIEAYTDHTPATLEGTRRWLAKFVLDNPSKVLFLVCPKDSKPMGHMGLANGLQKSGAMEMDNIVRGIKAGEKGLMTLALYDLITWVFVAIGVNRVYLRVFSDNANAIKMYTKLNFVEKHRYPLLKSKGSGSTKFKILDSSYKSGLYFSYMELSRTSHFSNYEKVKKTKRL